MTADTNGEVDQAAYVAEIERLRAENYDLRKLLGDYLLSYQEARDLNALLRKQSEAVNEQPGPTVTTNETPPVSVTTAGKEGDVQVEPAQEFEVVQVPAIDPVIDRIGKSYVNWCNRGGPLVSRYFMFEKYLQKDDPRALVRAIFRSKGAAGITFHTQTNDPVEYWMVESGQLRLLLPQPQNDSCFREVEPCFEGKATVPKSLQSIVPTFLEEDGGRWICVEKGKLY
jgi:hypothetical protein